MAIEYAVNGPVSPSEMLSLATAVGFGRHRSLARNATAIAGSLFVATARRDGELVGLIRLIGDGAYVLHVADMGPAKARWGPFRCR